MRRGKKQIGRAAGFSIVELMVSMAILLAVMAVALTALNQAFRASEAVTLMADLEENLRAGMNYMIRDIIQCGAGIPTGGVPIPYGAGLTAINRPAATGTMTFPASYSTIPAVTPGDGLGPNILEPSDIITVLYADNTYPLQQFPIVNASNPVCNGSMKVQSKTLTIVFDTACAKLIGESIAIKAGDLIMLSNSQGYALQTVTGVSTGTNTLTFAPGDAFALNGNDNSGGNPSGTLGTIESPAFSGKFPPTTATRIWMISYFLNVSDPTRPSLMRQRPRSRGGQNAPMQLRQRKRF